MKKQKKQTTPLSTQIFITYWDAIIDLTHIDSKGYAKAVQQLENGEYQSVDFDLKNRKGALPLYGMRLNNADRVLCTTIKVNEKAYLLLLELVLNHDYQKARFMADGVLEEFIARNHDAFADYIKKQAQLIESSQQKNTKFSYRSLTLHQNKIIQLSDEQNAILSSQNKALLITGGPGSGKSVLALSVLDKALEQDNGSPTGETLLYVSQSYTLVSKMERIWNEQSHSNPFNKKVVFRTYDNLLKEHSHLNDNNIVSKSHVTTWIKSYLKKAINKQNPTLNELLTSPDNDESKIIELFYQEFRIISGYELKEYFPADTTHSAVSSLFPNVTHRKWLSSAYSAYLNCLSSEGKAHPAFFTISKDIKYSFIAVDESQDFSLGQLRTLHLWSTENRIVFFNDSHQILSDNKSKTQYILDLLNKGPCAQILLNGSYRCPREVVSFANAIMELKLILTGGLTDKHQQAQLKLNKEQEEQHPTQANAVQWFECIEDISNQTLLFEKIKDSAQVAIVTLSCYKEEAKKRFNTVSVFTPEEIKGLEFSFVIAYQLLDEEFFHTANAEPVMAELEQHKVPKNRPKADKENNQFGPSFNRLYTAVTRCTGTLIFIQKSSHQIKHIAEYLKSKINSSQTTTSTVQVDDLTKDSPQTWLKRATEALEHNNQEYAENIFITHLDKSGINFTQWKAQFEHDKNSQFKDQSTKKEEIIAQPNSLKNPLNRKEKKQAEQKIKQQKALERIIDTALIKDTFISVKNSLNIKKLLLQALDENNVSPFHYLLQSAKGRGLFLFLMNDVSIQKKIILHEYWVTVLCTLTNDHNRINGNSTILNWLSVSTEGIELLSTLCQNTKFLMTLTDNELFFSAFVTRRNQGQGVYSNSLLDNLVPSTKGHKLLLQLATNNSFIERLTLSDLFFTNLLARCTHLPGAKKNTCPLFWLLFDKAGYRVFNQLISHPNFKKKLCSHEQFFTELFVVHNELPDVFANTSLLYWLSSKEISNEFLTELYISNLFIEKYSTSDNFFTAFFARRAHHAKKNENASALYWLLNDKRGASIFLLLCCNPLFVEKICSRDDFFSAFFARRNQLAGEFENTSGLYWLLKDDDGSDVLQILCKIPSFIEKRCFSNDFIMAFLARRNQLAGRFENTSALYWLLVDKRGRDVFIELFSNSILVDELCEHDDFFTALFALRNQDAGEMKNDSALYCMLTDDNSSDLFAQIYSTPLFVKTYGISNEFFSALFAQPGQPIGHDSNITAFYWLLENEDGFTLFEEMCNNSLFVDKLCKDDRFFIALFARRSSFAEEFENTSALYWILMNNKGAELFENLYKHPIFVDKIHTSNDFITTLLARRNSQAEEGEHISALYLMLTCTKGCALFAKLCSYPYFIEKLITHDNFQPIFIADKLKSSPDFADALHAPIQSIDQSTSLFLLLSNSENGLSLLKMLGETIEYEETSQVEYVPKRFALFTPKIEHPIKKSSIRYNTLQILEECKP